MNGVGRRTIGFSNVRFSTSSPVGKGKGKRFRSRRRGKWDEAWCEGLWDEIRRERIEPRRNRINPRVIKRKMKNWLKKRLEH